MAISGEEVLQRWFGGLASTVPATALAESFSRLERLFGRDWLESRHGLSGPLLGLPLHELGEQLALIENLMGKEQILDRLKRADDEAGDGAAGAELEAIHLCAHGTSAEIEIGPTVTVNGGEKKPDFRIRMLGEDWVHVEVVAPELPEPAQLAREAMFALTGSCPAGVAAEVRFRVEPTASDFAAARTALLAPIGEVQNETPAFVLTRVAAPATYSPSDDGDHRPRVVMSAGRVTDNKQSQLTVSVPYTDERAQAMLDHEARQLPKEGANLVCMKTMHVGWAGLLQRAFNRTVGTRVSAAMLWESVLMPTASGVQICLRGQLIRNPRAKVSLPSWLDARLASIPGGWPS